MKINLLGIIVFFMTACVSTPEITHPEYKMLTEIPKEQVATEFGKFPLEKQLEINDAAIQLTRSAYYSTPSYSFVGEVIKNKEVTIPFLIAELKKLDYTFPRKLTAGGFHAQTRRLGLIAMFNAMAQRDGCKLKITQDELNYLLKETLETHFGSDYPKYYIFELLHCPQFNCKT